MPQQDRGCLRGWSCREVMDPLQDGVEATAALLHPAQTTAGEGEAGLPLSYKGEPSQTPSVMRVPFPRPASLFHSPS